jgi:hypothetical protein
MVSSMFQIWGQRLAQYRQQGIHAGGELQEALAVAIETSLAADLSSHSLFLTIRSDDPSKYLIG